MHSKEQSLIPNVAEGVTKGVLSWGKEEIKTLAKNFLDKKLIFINNKETIDLVKEQLKSGDWSLCKQYLKDKNLKILVQLGLTLRKLESKPEQLQDLKNKIVNKYGAKGVHVAEVVQNGILTEFVGSIASKAHSEHQIIESVENILLNVDKFFLFIKSTDSPEKKVQEINIKLQANNPDAIILFSYKSAIETCKQIKILLESDLKNYYLESKEEKDKYLVFIFRESADLFE
ncbi:MAG: hypothetical protein AABW48_01075 [Nanoarchaeota archaeon]